MTTVNFGPLVAGATTVVGGQAWYCDGTRWIPASMSTPSVDYIAKHVCVGSESSITFSDLPQDFTDLEILYNGREVSGVGLVGMWMKFNGDATAANYRSTQNNYGINGGTSFADASAPTTAGALCGIMNGVSGNADAINVGQILIPNYAGTAFYKGFIGLSGGSYTAGAAYHHFGGWNSAVPITSITFTPTSAFVAGTTFVVYGRGRSLSVSGVSGLILREEKIASASAQLDFTNWYNSSFDEYVLELIGIVNGSSAIPQLRCSVDGGATFDSGSNYASIYGHSYSGGTAAGGSNSTTQVNLVDTAKLPTAGGSWNGSIRLFTPGSTSLWKNFIGQVACYNSSDGLVGSSIYGTYKSMSAINALRVLMSTGNITSGAVRIYAVAR